MAKWNRGKPAPNVKLDMVGKKFGRLTVIERYPENTKDRKAQWICKCDCGKTTVVSGKQLRTGKTLSCGCLRSEANIKRNYKHGGSFRKHKERLYGIYLGMIRRCYETTRKEYSRYGGRGIRICSEWYVPGDVATGYKRFRSWAYANGYYDQPKDTPKSLMLSIDRIDNDGPYAPWNCRWQNMYGQSNNRGKFNKHIQDIDGTVYTYGEFERKYGLKSNVTSMIGKGWTIDQIINYAHNIDLGLNRLYKQDGFIRDKDGFIHLTPHIDQSKARDKDGK